MIVKISIKFSDEDKQQFKKVGLTQNKLRRRLIAYADSELHDFLYNEILEEDRE